MKRAIPFPVGMGVVLLAVCAAACTTEPTKESTEAASAASTEMKRPAKTALSEAEVADGLRQALGQGTETATKSAAKRDGFLKNSAIRVPFPPEITQVEKALANMGLSKVTESFVVSLNRAAELAAGHARPILISAIGRMSIEDALSVLKGPKTGATDYLRRTTAASLKERLGPVADRALEKAKVNRYWNPVAQAYNSLPIVTKVNPDLSSYVADRTLDGLFTLMAEEETKIRENPVKRSTDLLKRVFGYGDSLAAVSD